MALFKYCVTYRIPYGQYANNNKHVAVYCKAENDSQAVETALDLIILFLNDRDYLHCEMTAPDIVCFGMVEQFNATKEALISIEKVLRQIDTQSFIASEIIHSQCVEVSFEFIDRINRISEDTDIAFNMLHAAYGK